MNGNMDRLQMMGKHHSYCPKNSNLQPSIVSNKRSFILLKSDCDDVWYNSKPDGFKEIPVLIFRFAICSGSLVQWY